MANGTGGTGASQQDMLNLARYLVQQAGMSRSDVAELFGGMVGIPGPTPNYDELFAQYMPTFVQVNQFEPTNSIRRSIAKDVMDGVPLWEIEQGIANAVERGDVGLTPGTKISDLSNFARQLESEYRSYTNAVGKEEKNVFSELGVRDPSERYTVAEFFPEVINQLVDLGKENPTYKTGAVGSGAKLPSRVTTPVAQDSSQMVEQSRSEIESENQRLKDLKSILANKSVKASGFGTFDGKRMSLRDLISERSKIEDNIALLKKSEEEAMAASWAKTLSEREERKAKTIATNFAIKDFRSAEQLLNRAIKEGGETKFRDKDGYRVVSIEEAQQMFDSAANKLMELSPDSGYLKDFKPKTKTSSTSAGQTSTGTPGPGGYVGPARGESTMARTYDPYWNKVTKGVLAGLQQRLDSSGRTPFMDDMARIGAFYKFIGK